MRAALIPADPATPCRIVDVAGDSRALASAISAEYVERVRAHMPAMALVVDEAGLLKGLPENQRLSGFLYSGTIVGDALIMSEERGFDGVDFVTLEPDHESFARSYLDGWAE